MLHSSRFNEIKEYWEQGKWSLLWLKQDVQSGHITKEEYKEITGKEYESLSRYYEYHSDKGPISII